MRAPPPHRSAQHTVFLALHPCSHALHSYLPLHVDWACMHVLWVSASLQVCACTLRQLQPGEGRLPAAPVLVDLVEEDDYDADMDAQEAPAAAPAVPAAPAAAQAAEAQPPAQGTLLFPQAVSAVQVCSTLFLGSISCMTCMLYA
jgi:hypothetical protein